jgi:hypothetical protein
VQTRQERVDVQSPTAGIGCATPGVSRTSVPQARNDTSALSSVPAGDLIVAWRWRQTARTTQPVEDWITREFACRGLVPPHCTPEALARALERERGISIRFVPHASEESGVYGLVYHHEGRANTYSIVFRPTPNLVLRRLILFHELAHLLFDHLGTKSGGDGALRSYMVTDAEDAVAEAFAVGAMQYSFSAEDPLPQTDTDADGAPSAFEQYLQRTAYWP